MQRIRRRSSSNSRYKSTAWYWCCSSWSFDTLIYNIYSSSYSSLIFQIIQRCFLLCFFDGILSVLQQPILYLLLVEEDFLAVRFMKRDHPFTGQVIQVVFTQSVHQRYFVGCQYGFVVQQQQLFDLLQFSL